MKIGDKRFSSLKNDFELTFNNDTQVQECCESDASIPTTQFNFMPIEKIANIEVNTMIGKKGRCVMYFLIKFVFCMVDVIGVSKSAGDVLTFQSKSTGRELKKREVTLVDRTNSSVSV